MADKPLDPPRMRRVVTVDRRALPETPPRKVGRYDELTLEQLAEVGERLSKQDPRTVQGEIADWNSAYDRAHRPLTRPPMQVLIDQWIEARRAMEWI